VLSKHALDGRGGDAIVFGDPAQAVALAAITPDGGMIENQGISSDVASFETGPPHAGADPLDNKVAFQLRDGADDDGEGTAQRAAGVDLLAEADELDVEPVQLVEHFEEVFHDLAIRSEAQTRSTSKRPRRAPVIN